MLEILLLKKLLDTKLTHHVSHTRKGLVEIFDKLGNGQLNEGLALQHLVECLHQKR